MILAIIFKEKPNNLKRKGLIMNKNTQMLLLSLMLPLTHTMQTADLQPTNLETHSNMTVIQDIELEDLDIHSQESLANLRKKTAFFDDIFRTPGTAPLDKLATDPLVPIMFQRIETFFNLIPSIGIAEIFPSPLSVVSKMEYFKESLQTNSLPLISPTNVTLSTYKHIEDYILEADEIKATSSQEASTSHNKEQSAAILNILTRKASVICENSTAFNDPIDETIQSLMAIAKAIRILNIQIFENATDKIFKIAQIDSIIRKIKNLLENDDRIASLTKEEIAFILKELAIWFNFFNKQRALIAKQDHTVIQEPVNQDNYTKDITNIGKRWLEIAHPKPMRPLSAQERAIILLGLFEETKEIITPGTDTTTNNILDIQPEEEQPTAQKHALDDDKNDDGDSNDNVRELKKIKESE